MSQGSEALFIVEENLKPRLLELERENRYLKERVENMERKLATLWWDYCGGDK